MNQLIIFLTGLAFLLFFSYRDLKYSKVENRLILVYFFLTLGILLLTGNIILQSMLALFWVLFAGLLWKLNNIGGADLKILIINSIYISLIVPNAIAGQFMFIMIFGIHGMAYGIFAKLIKTKKEIPFIPIITLTYILNYIFWIL